MSRPVRRGQALRYAGWICAPLAFLALALWVERDGGDWRAPGSDFQRGLAVSDAKLRRTLDSFDAAGLLQIELAEAGGEGLPIELTLAPDALALIRVKENRARFKDRAIDATVRIAEGPRLPATLSLRGETSLWHGRRPNFELDLLRPQPFAGGFALRKLFLMAMNEDPHQIVARFGYRVFGDLGLYPTHVQFVRLAVNGAAQGLYLLLESPRWGLRRVFPDTVAIHRRLGRYRYRTYWTRDVPSESASLNRFRTARHTAPGKPLDKLERALDLDAYLTYLAANSVLLNADTGAELFFYERRNDPNRPAPLRPMAWDLDDIGSRRAKPGSLDDPLIFSSRDPFDRLIHQDPSLRARYTTILVHLLREQLTESYLREALTGALRMRDALDDGLPEAEQRAAQTKRAAFAKRLEQRLLERRRVLLATAGPAA